MVDDSISAMPAQDPEPGPAPGGRCPWCSAALPADGADECPSCQARLVEAAGVEIPGVTSVDPALLAAAAAPRKIKRNLGMLLVGNDDEIPLPSEAEMPALARPAADVRREIIRLQMDARLTSLKAEVAARDAEGAARLARGAPLATGPASEEPPDAGPGTGPATEEPPGTGPQTGPVAEASPGTGEPPGRD